VKSYISHYMTLIITRSEARRYMEECVTMQLEDEVQKQLEVLMPNSLEKRGIETQALSDRVQAQIDNA
jgi:response regulator RpfG family c-di-GMP phosphodiesterase